VPEPGKPTSPWTCSSRRSSSSNRIMHGEQLVKRDLVACFQCGARYCGHSVYDNGRCFPIHDMHV
jgi:hypothetical protein